MNNVLENIVSFFASFFDNDPICRKLHDVVAMALSDGVKHLTEEIRRQRGIVADKSIPVDKAMAAKNKADKLKRQLPSFMTNAVCEFGKTRKNITQFLPFVGFDVDHITEDRVMQLMEQMGANSHVVIAEPSCSRQGIHFMLMMDASEWLNSRWDEKMDIRPYEFVWQQVRQYVETTFCVVVDEKCKNPEHIFGICYDSSIHYKESPVPLHIDTANYVEPVRKAVIAPRASLSATPVSINDVSERIIGKLSEWGETFSVGNRNNYVLRFAQGCNKYGVQQTDAETFCCNNFAEPDFNEKEILATVRSAYRNTAEHGTLCAVCADAQRYSEKESKVNSLIINNTISHEQRCANAQTAHNAIIEDLEQIDFCYTFSDKIPEDYWCDYLRTVYSTMEEPQDRDKMLLNTLTVNSAMEPNFYCLYSGHTVYPPLYLMTFGKTASRKGEVAFCQRIIEPLDREIIVQYQKELEEYKRDHSAWEAKGAKASDKANRGEEPKEPTYRQAHIPANSSAAAFDIGLEANGGWGLMFETEAVTLQKSLISDFGDYSDTLLKSFHHEEINKNRIKDKLHISIKEPRLAAALTCTPGLLRKLFPTFEDGFANRFLFYGLDRKLEWVNPFKPLEKPLDEVYEELGRHSLELYHQLQARGNRRIQFLLKEEQIAQFNNFFSELLMEQFYMLGDGISSFIFRLGLSAIRFAMVLTMLRRYSEWKAKNENGCNKPLFEDNEQAILCDEKDFFISMTIVNTLVNHTAAIYSALAKDDEGLDNAKLAGMTAQEKALYNALGQEFTSNDVHNTAITLNTNPDTARRYLGNFVSRYHVVKRIKNGSYVKLSTNRNDQYDTEK